jgi:hypothetical protein
VIEHILQKDAGELLVTQLEESAGGGESSKSCL